jgi:uncharacterized protein YbaP (TraB family)
MQIRLLWFIILGLCGSNGFRALGQTERAFLWEAKNQSSIVYLAGSVHLLRSADLPFSQAMEQAFERSEQAVFEINLDDALSFDTVLLTLTKGTYLPPDSLRAHLSKETYDKLEDYRQANGLASLDLYRPWLLNQVLSDTELEKAGFSAKFGVDQHFFDNSKQRGKTILALESATFQIELLASLSEDGQVASAERFLADPAADVTQTTAIVDSWSRGDAEGLRQLVENEVISDPQAFEQLLVQRNRNWLPLIEGYLRENKTTFLVVGAAHLVGGDGLINLLRNKGYNVQQWPRDTNSISAPRFGVVEKHGDSVQLSMEVEPGLSYSLQASSDLQRWTNVTTFLATNSVHIYPDATDLRSGSRLFRLRTPAATEAN